MRNLRNIKHARFKFEHEKTNLSATAWDANDDSLVLGFGPSEDDPAITLKRLPFGAQHAIDAISIASWDAPSPNPDLAIDRIINLHCFSDTRSISLVLAGGDIVIVREEPQSGQDSIEIVGSVDAGISAAAWSPDEELLVIVTAADTLIFMTRDFEGVANVTLSPEDVKVSNHVSVGWGKKETQFKGRGVAKTLRDPTVPEYVDEGTLSLLDDAAACISWRGDGQYLAINSILETEPRRRIIRVYSREGTLESVSEPINGLEGALSWKPSGQTIAGVQRRDDRIDVVFFERNGLRHGQFSLRLDETEITSTGSKITLGWNVDSTILAVSMADRIQLWTVSNYQYYLKQEIRFDEISGPASFKWHPEKPLDLVSTNDRELRHLTYKFQVCRGSVSPPNDLGTVAVIDGKMLKVTPLRIANIPPPMAFDEIELPSNALDVDINRDGTEIAVLHRHSFSLWECDYSLRPAKKATLKSVVDVSATNTNEEVNGAASERDHCIKVTGGHNLFTRTDHDRIFYQSEMRSDTEDNMSVFLDESGTLHLKSSQQVLTVRNCTSFVATSGLLIYTTSQHILKFIHLLADQLEAPPDDLQDDERCRSIERGAKIVTVIPSACSLVLQMPRGNLETIYPRALVLAKVRESIDHRDYKTALLTCRTHRVDMNILYDLRPGQFMNSVESFVTQIPKLDHMDLFLSSLLEEDVTKTIYRSTLRMKAAPTMDRDTDEGTPKHAILGTSKVNSICDAILLTLQKHLPSRIQNVVTAHVCKNPPDLEAGLKLVLSLRSQNDEETLEHAVEHICFLSDVNQLYDAALGIYELDVALLIAEQSQKDPREYMPYLQSLQDMQSLRRHFTIDNDLKRYSKAIEHLHALGDFEEVKSYMRKHDLYTITMKLYRYDDFRLTELTRLYADYLSTRNQWKEAGVAYEYVSDHTSAYEVFRTANLWRECLSNAMLADISRSKLQSLAEDIANALEESKDFKSAAIIHLDYLHDLERAAKLLCKGYDFAEAIRLFVLHEKAELLRTVVDTGLIESAAATTELLADMKSQLKAQVPRLGELREKKAEDPMAFLDGADGADNDIPDNLSLAPTDASTSGNTFMTKYTNRSSGTLATNATRKTSKNRRREERKRARGKKGTVYEEEYLVNSIVRLTERLNDVVEDVSKLVQGLLRRGMRERAVAVQNTLEEVHGLCADSLNEVFSQAAAGGAEPNQGTGDGEMRPWGGQGVLFDAEKWLNSRSKDVPTLKPLESFRSWTEN